MAGGSTVSGRGKLAGLALVTLLALSGCASVPPSLPAPPVRPNGGVLWRLIDTGCVPDQLQRQDPAPCTVVSIANGRANGFAVLKDREGVAQYLLMPTRKITGIEDPAILAAGAPNYFAEAWNARHLTETKLGRPVMADEMSIAVNSIYGRTQDQLHLHIDCLSADVHKALQTDAGRIGPKWSRHPFVLAGQPYWIRRIKTGSLDRTNPFNLLAATMPGARRQMGAWTLVLTGATGQAADLFLIAGRAQPAAGDNGSGESLQDHSCGAHQSAVGG